MQFPGTSEKMYPTLSQGLFMLISSRIIKKNQNHRTITENNKSRGAGNPKNLSYIPLSEISTGQNPRHDQVFYIQQPGRD